MSSAFVGLLTRDESGNLFHCGFPVKWGMCSECYIEGCFVAFCRDWDCGWDSPDCVDLDEVALTFLAVV
jgi:hypothetical protein